MEQVEAFCRQWDMLPEGGVVLCALSGGRDSMALLQLLGEMAAAGGFTVAAAHYNHHLRPTADRDEAFVRAWCRERGVPLLCGGGDVRGFAREAGTSLEDAARTLRYRFLEAAADALGAGRIATAHHREDNAETVLLHLLRGAGLQGLGGIPPVRGRIVRPLLAVSRAEIDRYVNEKCIPYVDDESNQNTVYTRNRLRLEALPLLEDLAPGCTGRVARTAALLREENDYLDSLVRPLVPPERGGELVLPAAVLSPLEPVLRRRLVRLMARRLGAELSEAHVEAALALGSGGYLDLPGGLCAVRQPHRLILGRRKVPPAPLELALGRQSWGPYTVCVAETGASPGGNAVVLDRACVTGPITIAAWDGTGRLAVENGSRTIKRLFADRGIPVEKRGEHPALYLEGRPIALFGVAVDWNCKPRPGERRLTVALERKECGDDLLL